jgi:putative membrane protein
MWGTALIGTALLSTAWGYWGWGWWLFGAIVFVVIFLLIAIAAGHGRTDTPDERALRERYARGEISIEEYRRRLRDLHRAA